MNNEKNNFYVEEYYEDGKKIITTPESPVGDVIFLSIFISLLAPICIGACFHFIF